MSKQKNGKEKLRNEAERISRKQLSIKRERKVHKTPTRVWSKRLIESMNERKTERKTVALELTQRLLVLSQGWRGLAGGIGRSGKIWIPGPQCHSLSLMSGSTTHSGDMQRSPECEMGQETLFSPPSSQTATSPLLWSPSVSVSPFCYIKPLLRRETLAF